MPFPLIMRNKAYRFFLINLFFLYKGSFPVSRKEFIAGSAEQAAASFFVFLVFYPAT
jgi:hypothetical protein